MIIDDYSTKNAGGVTISQMHASLAADIDGDVESYTDADPYGAPVLYWFRTVRNPKAPGGASSCPS
jgi:hypothetical protein